MEEGSKGKGPVIALGLKEKDKETRNHKLTQSSIKWPGNFHLANTAEDNKSCVKINVKRALRRTPISL